MRHIAKRCNRRDAEEMERLDWEKLHWKEFMRSGPESLSPEKYRLAQRGRNGRAPMVCRRRSNVLLRMFFLGGAHLDRLIKQVSTEQTSGGAQCLKSALRPDGRTGTHRNDQNKVHVTDEVNRNARLRGEAQVSVLFNPEFPFTRPKKPVSNINDEDIITPR